MEEERKNPEDYTEEEKARAMSMALHWLCSPRGGNNFYGRILNGCGRAPKKDLRPPSRTSVTTTPRKNVEVTSQNS